MGPLSRTHPSQPLEPLRDRGQIPARRLIQDRRGKLAAFPSQLSQVLGRWQHPGFRRFKGAGRGYDGHDLHVTTSICDLSGA